MKSLYVVEKAILARIFYQNQHKPPRLPSNQIIVIFGIEYHRLPNTSINDGSDAPSSQNREG